jgi:hypothetical protein
VFSMGGALYVCGPQRYSTAARPSAQNGVRGVYGMY